MSFTQKSRVVAIRRDFCSRGGVNGSGLGNGSLRRWIAEDGQRRADGDLDGGGGTRCWSHQARGVKHGLQVTDYRL